MKQCCVVKGVEHGFFSLVVTKPKLRVGLKSDSENSLHWKANRGFCNKSGKEMCVVEEGRNV